MTDSTFDHVNEQITYDKMLSLRDLLGELAAAGVHAGNIDPKDAYELGESFASDMVMFRFMDESPGHHLINGRPPEGERGGPGNYYDGQGRVGWHTLLRQLRNGSDEFWAGFAQSRA